MIGQRLIDENERIRKKPMCILVLGMCRTGTTSISVALRKLGYTPHQMRDILVKPKELALWQEAINSKQKVSAPYGKPEFDKLLGDYDVVMDLPGCIFAKELIEAYPDAKVISTKRAYGDWEASMQESIWCLDTWKLFTFCRRLNVTQLAPLMRLIHSLFRVHNGNNYGGPAAKAAYEEHYDTVRSLARKDRLLELNVDSELTWKPLCEFLGTEIPKEPYPKLKEEKAMRKNLENAWWRMVQYLCLMILLPGLVTVGALLLYTYAHKIKVLRDEWIIVPLRSYLDA